MKTICNTKEYLSQEWEEIENRCKVLSDYLGTEEYNQLKEVDKSIVATQLSAMYKYLDCIDVRFNSL